MDLKHLADSYVDYIISELNLSSATVQIYSREIGMFISYLGDQKIAPDSITTSHIEDYIASRPKEGHLTSRTVSRIMSSLRSFFKFLQLEDVRRDNPVAVLDMPKSGHVLPKVFSNAEVDSFFDSIALGKPAGIRDRALFEVIYSCGLRISEVADHVYARHLKDTERQSPVLKTTTSPVLISPRQIAVTRLRFRGGKSILLTRFCPSNKDKP